MLPHFCAPVLALAALFARRSGPRTVRLLVAAPLLAALLAGGLVAPHAASAAVQTYGNDALRTGWYPNEPGLTPALVGGSTFGQQFATAVDGQVYAQPLVSGGRLLVATETNHAYGLSPASGAVQWSRALGTPWNPADLGCADLTPSVGVTGTPVVDPASGTEYLFSKTYVSGASGPAAYYVHALDVATGAERPNFPVLVHGSASNDPRVGFDATRQLERPGLLLLDGVVYAGFGGHCDSSPYQGWVVGVSTTGVLKTLWTAETDGGNGAGIWQSGGGLASDGKGQILLTTGNGTLPAVPTAGRTPPGQLGQAVVRLAVQPDGTLKATDYFAPYDAATLNGWDADLGSGGPMGLPAGFGTTAHPHLMVQVGKQGYVYLLDRDDLGGMGQGPSGGDAVVSRVGPDGGVWSKPAAWPGDGGYVYIPTASAGTTTGAVNGVMNAYRYGVDGAGSPTLSLVGRTSDRFGLSSSPPVISSNGTRTGSAIVWVICAPGGAGTYAQLRAYAPVPVDGTLQLIRSFSIGTSSKFNPPAVDGNRVYVGTRDGRVLGFGAPADTPMSGGAVSWPATTLGTSSVRTATLTANTALTVTAVAASTDFTPGTTTPALPATLAAGGTLSVPVTYRPSVVGQQSGTLTVTTSAGPVTVGLTGSGQAATGQISAAPTAISFGGVAIGRSTTSSVTFSDTGAQAVTVTSLARPAAPFTATGLPAVGTVLQPGASVTATVSFSPTAAGAHDDAVSVGTSAGTATVTMSGTAAPPGALTITPGAVDVGAVALGGAATASFTVANTGGSALTVTKSKPPVAGTGFTAVSTLTEGTTLAAGSSRTETVLFSPRGVGTSSDAWTITTDDGSGVRTVGLTGEGVTGSQVPDPAAGGWQLNGSSVLTGGGLQLTAATQQNVAGTAFWPTAVASADLDVSFDAAIDSGNGADGLTLLLADPARGATPTSVGQTGGGLGYAAIPGVAVALDTHRNDVDPSNNFVGIATDYVHDGKGNLVWAATSTGVPALRGTPHRVRVRAYGGQLTVSVDGTQVLSRAVALGPTTLLGFSAATGAVTDRHAISDVSIVSAGGAIPSLAVADTAVSRPTAGTAPMTFTVGLSAPAPGPVTFTYRTVDGTGVAGRDYVALAPRTVTLPAGRTTQTVAVSVIGSGLHGTAVPDVHLVLSGVSGARLADGDGQGRIINPLGPLSLSVTDAVVHPPTDATFHLTLSSAPAPGESVTVVVATADGTVTAGGGAYTPVGPTTVTFAPGSTALDVLVPVHAGAGTFSLGLRQPSADAVLADDTGLATLAAPGTGPGPALSVSDAVAVRPVAGTGQVTVRFSLSAPAVSPVSFTWRTADGSALAGTDYVAVPSTTVTIPAGQRTADATVLLSPRAAPGPVISTFAVLVSDITGAPAADAAGTVRLINALGP